MTLPKSVRYIVSGGTAALTNLCLFFVLVHVLSVQYLIASALAFSAGIATSFILHKFWTFNNQEISHMHFQFALYMVITLGNLLVNTLLVYIFVDWFNILSLLAQLLAGAIIAVTSYFIYQKFVFAPEQP